MESMNAVVKNALTIDVEDYYQVSAFDSIVQRVDWGLYESRVESNTLNVLSQLGLKGVRGTFFILGWVAERYPELVKRIFADGHEVACHGYSHRLVYEQSPTEFQSETKLAKKILEDIIGESVLSYRAASYSITRQSLWALDILAEEGFRYDSSIFPVIHDRYGIPGAHRSPHILSLDSGRELAEFPVSTLSVCGYRVPMAGGGYFRLFPYQVTRRAIRRLNQTDGLPVVFYLHPWEFDPGQPKQPVSGISRFRHYFNLHKTAIRFGRLLDDFTFAPLAEVAESFPFVHASLSEFLGGNGSQQPKADGIRSLPPGLPSSTVVKRRL